MHRSRSMQLRSVWGGAPSPVLPAGTLGRARTVAQAAGSGLRREPKACGPGRLLPILHRANATSQAPDETLPQHSHADRAHRPPPRDAAPTTALTCRTGAAAARSAPPARRARSARGSGRTARACAARARRRAARRAGCAAGRTTRACCPTCDRLRPRRARRPGTARKSSLHLQRQQRRPENGGGAALAARPVQRVAAARHSPLPTKIWLSRWCQASAMALLGTPTCTDVDRAGRGKGVGPQAPHDGGVLIPPRCRVTHCGGFARREGACGWKAGRKGDLDLNVPCPHLAHELELGLVDEGDGAALGLRALGARAREHQLRPRRRHTQHGNGARRRGVKTPRRCLCLSGARQISLQAYARRSARRGEGRVRAGREREGEREKQSEAVRASKRRRGRTRTCSSGLKMILVLV